MLVPHTKHKHTYVVCFSIHRGPPDQYVCAMMHNLYNGKAISMILFKWFLEIRLMNLKDNEFEHFNKSKWKCHYT